MTKKHIRVLVAAYLFVAAAASSPFWFGRLADRLPWHKASPIAFEEYDEKSTDKFSFGGNGQALAFEKKDGAWEVNGKAANQDAVKTFFDVLRSTSITRTVSRNKDNHSVYGVDEAGGITLHVEQGGKTLDVIVGEGVTGIRSFFLRQTSDDIVYEATGALRQLATRPESNWIPEPTEGDATESPSSSET